MTTIGRLGKNDVVLNDSQVSREHARIERRSGILYITDLNSTNGTILNGRRLQPYVPYQINEGDTICMGDFNMRLRVAARASAKDGKSKRSAGGVASSIRRNAWMVGVAAGVALALILFVIPLKTESYTVKELYETTETYVDKEPYETTEEYTVPVEYKYMAPCQEETPKYGYECCPPPGRPGWSTAPPPAPFDPAYASSYWPGRLDVEPGYFLKLHEYDAPSICFYRRCCEYTGIRLETRTRVVTKVRYVEKERTVPKVREVVKYRKVPIIRLFPIWIQ
jgi:hypothetical protein